METKAVNTLFCLQEPRGRSPDLPASVRPEPCVLRQALAQLNLTSTCYLVASPGRDAVPFLSDRVEEAAAFLARHGFVQSSLRPVHTVAPSEMEAWMSLYERFRVCLRPFQQEGYREQIVSRLRIFPVLFFPGAEAVESCRPFLRYLNRNFFLPSLLLPGAEACAAAQGLSSASHSDWERVYFTNTGTFAPEPTLATLHAHAVCDLLLERSRRDPFDGHPLCAEIGVIRGASLMPACPLGSVGADRGVDARLCASCVTRILDETEESFLQDGREEAWREVAERFAGGLQKHGYNAEAVPVWERCFQRRSAVDVPLHQQLQKALCRYGSGDLDGAMGDLAELRRLNADSPEVRFYMGRCEFAWRDYIEAADRFREAVELGLAEPMKQEAEYLRGESHVHLGEFGAALDALRRAEEAGRADSPLYFYQALCLLDAGDPGGAVDLFKKALAAGPSQDDLFHVLFYTAHALKESASFSDALEFCARAEALNTNHQELYNLKGFCHFKLGQHEAAIRCFERCIEIDPRSAIDYANIGSNLRDMGDLEGAAAMYRRALAMDPTIDFARESLRRIEKNPKTF